MNGGQQQAYDRGTNIFSPDGRLYQVEYAREAVRRGSVSVGVRTRDGVVLAARKHVRSPLLEADGIEKLHKIDDHLGVVSAGHVADARRLVDFGRRRAQTDRLRYGEPIGVEPFTKAVTDHVQEFTQQGGARPFGAALLVGGVEPTTADEDPKPRLFETDPSGTPHEWRATAIGANDDTVREYLEANYDPQSSVQSGIELALSALADAEDGPLAPEEISVATVAPTYRALDADARRDTLDSLDLLDEQAS
ncbi:proteasome subunit alpha [Haladaptatus paucihalophilus DX253]|uniref:Proteasome subunit alpha n=1 Tax=Haladaptatus paucihalophilus DX253 TaxID=797209 RepID=E7QQR9_HALPU|nr:archaeal proteasome endopeptidase complex subunit alpha [Haladaptatus paucihalophilus]EFW93333.1 proteasome subunit alpha [Haladaptatus paucihalophilus DX253]SHK51667.1 proteasome subunit alpha 7 [Haladaptatus paucihalophilus DX253]